ncbi:MAG: hypothetical protein LBD11_01620 [Candidatus Peribacteria bacterium]|nr:hypothetical protein [Candidatus Peribacteria bacterium]
MDQKGFDPYFEVVSNARTKEYCKKLAPNESIVIPLFLDKDNNANHKNTLDSPIKIVPFTKEEVKNNIKVDLK